MNNKKQIAIIAGLLVLVISLGFNLYLGVSRYKLNEENELLGRFSQRGMLGIYNDTVFELGDAQGSAFQTDSNGKVVASPSSSIAIVGT